MSLHGPHSAASATPWEAPPPVLFNTWKHHAGALRHFIAQAVATGALDELIRQLVVIGTELMDLYLGELTPYLIGKQVLDQLRAMEYLERAVYQPWIELGEGYRLLTMSQDASQWCLRLGTEPDRYVHVHPARHGPLTCRVRANVLKTAVMLKAHVGIHGGTTNDVALVNQVRQQYLGLSPIRAIAAHQGLGTILDVLG